MIESDFISVMLAGQIGHRSGSCFSANPTLSVPVASREPNSLARKMLMSRSGSLES